MRTVICLGSKACDIGEKLENKDDYNVKLIDIDIEGENCYSIKQQPSPEEYEINTPNFKDFFANIDDNVLFITSGDSEVLSCSLKILQQIKEKNITILYLYPDTDFLNTINGLQNNLAFKVLQEYSRSGLFKEIILIDEKNTEASLNDMPVVEVYESYINLLCNTLNAEYNIEKSDPIIQYKNPPNNLCRIATYGYYSFENDIERLFFDLKNIENKCYNFFLNEDSIKTDNTLHRTIKQKIKNRADKNLKISYTIHSTKNKQNYCYVKAFTKFIQ